MAADGKMICWGFNSHEGCAYSECRHSHAAITTTAGLDWTVMAQLILCGGLKAGKKIAAAERPKRIATLRDQAQKALAEGKAKPEVKPSPEGARVTLDHREPRSLNVERSRGEPVQTTIRPFMKH